ncbi:putative tRNA-dihydrouridine(47) synthase [NAD(P)(+)] [Mytilinidion resinicola]|uniref:tRNA-dihydrouridine(47) synthase [NAD(P)(+)] n=1 Tax=Mytilinidion resinicola TaxID=574789 RepID=A0A6A6YH71_9PEZI|nr:putative tRNA-dihydrouridine(47) synthase [NAD(P)(+)] [Mytilinidion resinicola]KAF2808151.1 putative tRNA-dihydrouridine(47) synthase [NAD(P)(+)] [Mytilinidion resinicola]
MDGLTAWPTPERRKGVAQIKPEFLIHPAGGRTEESASGVERDDAAEASGSRYQADNRSDNRSNNRSNRSDNRQNGRDKKNKQKGQNSNRHFGSSRDKFPLCNSRVTKPEFSPDECQFGDKCKLEHNLRKYLKEGKREDLTVLGGLCPTWDSTGVCPVGWKCRFVASHSEERDTEDGRKELVLIEDAERIAKAKELPGTEDEVGVVNVVSKEAKSNLSKRITKTPKSDAYLEWTTKIIDQGRKNNERQGIREDIGLTKAMADNASAKQEAAENDAPSRGKNAEGASGKNEPMEEAAQENQAQYIEPPFLPSEKRRIYYGPETPILAPLTTQGNLPFRRLCVELGAQVTWSEMAMGMNLIQGERSEWALMKAHESEIRPPKYSPTAGIVEGYDNSKDIKFGAQIAANKPWLAVKTTEILTSHCPNLRAIDLNCGCPIELVCRDGAGSALLDSAGKLENILRGMNAVSQEVPITVKIRMGTKDRAPTADKLIKRLVLGGYETHAAGLGISGVAAITLHGRSKQQRYTRSADWGYIAECSALIASLKKERWDATDTAREADARHAPSNGKVYFVGNGDCYSHTDYQDHLQHAGVDSVMVARGALIKPWIFEEIESGQHLDKSATERLAYVEKFVKYGLQNWGSDEIGVGTTRKFLLEWLSFACRYVPVAMLEHLPPNIQDRAQPFRGRNELEALMSSDNYRDWIKISEMFLGPIHPNFRFEPKHKSNSYDIQAEG